MALFTLEFTNPLPEGLQAGNIAWYLDGTTGDEIMMGPIVAIGITPISITVDAPAGVAPPGANDFIFWERTTKMYPSFAMVVS